MKIKPLLSLCSLLICNAVFSQTKEIELPEGKQVIEYEFLKNKDIYFQFGNILNVGLSTPQNRNLVIYSPELKKESDKELTKVSLGVKIIATPTGKTPGFIREEGNVFSEKNTYYYSGNDYKIIKGDDNRGPLKDVFCKIYTDDYQVFFGKEKYRKPNKSLEGLEYNDLYFYRTDIKTLEQKLIKLDLPMQSFPNSRMFYQYQSHDNTKFYFILNELLNDKKKNVCSLVSFDYEGKLLEQIPFTLELENGKEFIISTTNNNNWVEKPKGGSLSRFPTDAAFIRLEINPDGKSFNVLGNFGDNKSKTDVEHGFYIYKYDFKGNLLWKMETENHAAEDTQKSFFMDKLVNLVYLKDNKIGFWCKVYNTDNSDFYIINNENGKILQKKTTKILGTPDYEFTRKKGLGGIANSNLYLADKFSDKIRMDSNTIFAINFSPEVEKYISTKVDSKFTGFLYDTAFYMIEENVKETKYKLLKFNWNF